MGGNSTKTLPVRAPESEHLQNTEEALYKLFMPSIERFTTTDANGNVSLSPEWQQKQANADTLANQAMKPQGSLMGQLGDIYNQNKQISADMYNTAKTGNIPQALTNNMNKAVNQGLQSGMGSMLNSLGGRGVLNSSITQKGVNNLAGQAANAFNQNYLTAYNSTIDNLAKTMTGNTETANSMNTGINTMGQVPTQAYDNLYAGITPAFNFWKTLRTGYDGREDYNHVVKSGK